MNDLRKAAQMAMTALACLDYDTSGAVIDGPNKEIADDVYAALNVALAQPELEPVAWMYVSPDNHEILRLHKLGATAPVGWAEHPLYTAPPQRQPLTQEQILSLFDSHNVYGSKWVDFARAIEKAHGIGGET